MVVRDEDGDIFTSETLRARGSRQVQLKNYPPGRRGIYMSEVNIAFKDNLC